MAMVAAGSILVGGNQVLAGSAQKSVESGLFLVGLYPNAYAKRLAAADAAVENGFVCDQNLCAAIGKNAAHFDQRELRVEGNRDAAGANNGKEPVKASPIIGAINRYRLARAKRDGLP